MQIGLSMSAIRDFQTAAAEACANTVIHGLANDPSRILNVALAADSEKLELTLLEGGDPFDPEHVREPDLTSSLEDRPIGGLGVYLMKQLMDELEFNVEQGVKRLRMAMFVAMHPAKSEG